MKQGTGRTYIGQRGGVKIEPLSKAVSVERVAQMGASTAFQKPALNAGRGYSAPKPVGKDVHHCGSQGKH